ncbi:MAG: flavodoxin family protein [Candidatus Freyarchaeota archaeon]
MINWLCYGANLVKRKLEILMEKARSRKRRNKMKILNLYYSMTGNTEKVAKKIEETLKELGHKVDTVKITNKNMELDILQYELVFVGSGVYTWLPGKPLQELYATLLAKYHGTKDIKPGSPRRPQLNAVVYCTYGGGHTGINEAIAAVKYMGQLFDHLGYNIIAEWYIVGEYVTENLKENNVLGRLGDIRGRPNEHDLREVTEKVKGIIKTTSPS